MFPYPSPEQNPENHKPFRDCLWALAQNQCPYDTVLCVFIKYTELKSFCFQPVMAVFFYSMLCL